MAARTARAIDVAGLDVARQRPNPDFAFEYDKETPHWAFTGTLPLEVSGKRQRRLDVATATLAVTDAETARINADLRADVRRAYFEAVAAERRITIAQQLEQLATRARDAAQERFQTGAAPRLEALQANLTLAQASNEVGAAQGNATAARAELNALLAYPLDAAPALTESLESAPLPTLEAATQQTLGGNAELNVLQKQIDEARARANLARALRHPDPSVMGALTYDAPGEFTTGWRLGANVALPRSSTDGWQGRRHCCRCHRPARRSGPRGACRGHHRRGCIGAQPRRRRQADGRSLSERDPARVAAGGTDGRRVVSRRPDRPAGLPADRPGRTRRAPARPAGRP